MKEIECPRCHRIDFGGVRYSCVDCHWPLRPQPVTGKVYGCDVLIEVQRQTLLRETEERHYKGTEAKARNRAKTVPGFRRVLAVVPYDEVTWINAYGEGRM